jgi:hypothetical protein
MNTEARKKRIKQTVAIATVALACAAALPVAVAGTATSRGSAKPARLLELVARTTQFTPIGFQADQDTPPAIGSRYILQAALFNGSAQFGKPAGAHVGSVELDCTFTTAHRNLCTGVAHVPDGLFTLVGANPSNGASVEWYAVTGGVSAYAAAHGQVKATNSQSGNRSRILVTLS